MSRKQVRTSLDLLLNCQNILPRDFKLFLRPHHDNGYIMYDQAQYFSFVRKQINFTLILRTIVGSVKKPPRRNYFKRR